MLFQTSAPIEVAIGGLYSEHHQVFGSTLRYDTIVVQETLQSSLRMVRLKFIKLSEHLCENMLLDTFIRSDYVCAMICMKISLVSVMRPRT